MGSSVRKTSSRIKKMLKDAIEVNPNIDCQEVIPQIAAQTLRSKKTKAYFGDKDFAILVGGGISCFKKAESIGFEKFLEEYNINDEQLTPINIQKVIELILDAVEDENRGIENLLILSAFESAMTEMLLHKITDPQKFLSLFCETFITMVIREDASEALIEVFSITDNRDMNKSIKDFSRDYVNKRFSQIIRQCCRDEIKIEELILKLQESLGKYKD